jgi:dienelactone hydrolase
MRLNQFLSTSILFLICSGVWVPALGAPQDSSFAFVARNTFADLLKIPLAAPEVSITVRSVKEEEGLRIEDIFWNTFDGQQVPAYVIRPAKATGRLPAIIFLHGTNGSRESDCTKEFGPGPWTNARGVFRPHLFHGSARELARRGYLTLAATQRGEDARMPDVEDQVKDMLIQGRTFMGANVYELRQAITYLQHRDDVDPGKIGMSGFSWGGVTTFYTWLVDLRIAAAAPLCGAVGSVETYSRKGSHTFSGTGWWIPDMLLKGDQADFASAMAPRPLMLWAPTEDEGMPKEGVDKFIATVRPAYERARAGDEFVVYQPPGPHLFTMETFDAMYNFFNQHLRK